MSTSQHSSSGEGSNAPLDAPTTPWVVMTTVASQEAAQALARWLVEDHLAGCVQVVPGLTSHYRFGGQQHEDQEWLLLIKTTAGAWPRLEASLAARHPYEEPEVLALPASGWSQGYARWLAQAVEGSDGEPG